MKKPRKLKLIEIELIQMIKNKSTHHLLKMILPLNKTAPDQLIKNPLKRIKRLLMIKKIQWTSWIR